MRFSMYIVSGRCQLEWQNLKATELKQLMSHQLLHSKEKFISSVLDQSKLVKMITLSENN